MQNLWAWVAGLSLVLATSTTTEAQYSGQNQFRGTRTVGYSTSNGNSPTRYRPSLSEATAILDSAVKTMYSRLEPGNSTPPNELLVYADLRVLRLYSGALEVASWSLEQAEAEYLRNQTNNGYGPQRNSQAITALPRYSAAVASCRTLLFRLRQTAEAVEHQAMECAPEVSQEWRREVLPALHDTIAAAEPLSLPGPGNSGPPSVPNSTPAPNDNPTTPEKVALGKQLFFDPRLSGDNRMSCATCHDPDQGFGDGLARGRGHAGRSLTRNTPTLLDVGYYSSFMWDGRASTLEEQALMPIQNPNEMDQDLSDLERELNLIPGYVRQFRDIFGTRVTRDGIAKALAAFERTLVTGQSPYDRYLAGDKSALSADARRGLSLFNGAAGCARCHSGNTLSDGQLYRLGVSYKDDGLGSITGKRSDKGKFRTASLRNIAQTAPYMHDGSKRTLFEAVEFYYGVDGSRTPDGLPLDTDDLTRRDRNEIPYIVAFLESLSGNSPRIDPPRLP